MILKPLPYNDPGQLVQLWMRFTGIGIPNDQNGVSAPEFMDLQQNNSFSQIAAIDDESFNINIGGTPERIEAAVVSAEFFPAARRAGAARTRVSAGRRARRPRACGSAERRLVAAALRRGPRACSGASWS